MSLETREEFLDRVDPIIIKQAHKQLKGSEILEVDDIIQEVRLKFWQEHNSLKGLDDSGISYAAYRAAAKFCERERTDYMYFTGAFIYSGDMVDYLLKDHAFTELDGDTDVEGRVDVQAAIDNLTPGQRSAVLKKYRDDADLTNAERVSADRALRSMTDYLNRGAKKSRVELNLASEIV